MGRTDLGGSSCNWSQGEASEWAGVCDDLLQLWCGSPGEQCTVLDDASLPCWPLGESGGIAWARLCSKPKRLSASFIAVRKMVTKQIVLTNGAEKP